MSVSRTNRRKRIKKLQRSAQSRLSQPSRLRTYVGDEEVVQLVEYEITYEPMPDPSLDVMTEADRERFDELQEAVLIERRAEVADELEALRNRYPTVPRIWNHLASIYYYADRDDEAERLIEETYCRFPGYSFGLIAYCDLSLNRGQIDEVRGILGNRLLIKLMFPERSVFHVSEVVCFTAMIIHFWMLSGNFEAAESNLNMLVEIAPDHPVTQQIEDQVERWLLESTPAQMLKLQKRSGARKVR